MSCAEERNSWEAAKAEDLVKLKKVMEEAFAEFESYQSLYDFDGNEGRQILTDCIQGQINEGNIKLNLFYYDDTYYGRCGDRDGSCSSLLTFISEDELKQHMRKYAENNVGSYCHHKFLASMENYGLYGMNESLDLRGSLLGYETSLKGITEKDIYSPERYSEIIAAREKAEQAKRDATAAETKRRQDQIDREHYERLKKKFG